MRSFVVSAQRSFSHDNIMSHHLDSFPTDTWHPWPLVVSTALRSSVACRHTAYSLIKFIDTTHLLYCFDTEHQHQTLQHVSTSFCSSELQIPKRWAHRHVYSVTSDISVKYPIWQSHIKYSSHKTLIIHISTEYYTKKHVLQIRNNHRHNHTLRPHRIILRRH